MRLFLGLALVSILALLAYIRLAPSDPAQWHVPVSGDEDRDYPGGALRILAGGQNSLSRLDEIARATPRTEVLAGSVAEGRITYLTRTFWIGFPDYTTVETDQGRLKLFARLRFGQSDLGVNRARLDNWLAQL